MKITSRRVNRIIPEKIVLTPHFDSHSTTESKSGTLLPVSTRTRIWHHGKMYVVLCMRTCAKKDDNFKQRRLNHYYNKTVRMGGRI